MKAKASHVGVEIELENAHSLQVPPSIMDVVEVKHDGSLRNYGREYVTTPLHPKDSSRAIKLIVEEARCAGAVASARTGFHVHVGARFTSPYARQRLFVCGLVADAYGRAFWPDRVGNTYCSLSKFVEHATRTAMERPFSEPFSHYHMSARYSPINVSAYVRHGTFEFRRGAMYDTLTTDDDDCSDTEPVWDKPIAYMGLVAACRRLAVDKLARAFANQAYEAVLNQRITEHGDMLTKLAHGVTSVALDLIADRKSVV